MNIYFTIYLVLVVISLLISANQHGKPRKEENFWMSLVSAVISTGLFYLALNF